MSCRFPHTPASVVKYPSTLHDLDQQVCQHIVRFLPIRALSMMPVRSWFWKREDKSFPCGINDAVKITSGRLQGWGSMGRRRSSKIVSVAAPETRLVWEVFYCIRKSRTSDGMATGSPETGPTNDRFQ